MATFGVGGPSRGLGAERVGLDAAARSDAPAQAEAAAPAAVSRVPLTSRPDPTRLAAAGAGASQPLPGAPADYLTTAAERDAYALLAGPEQPTETRLDRLDSLTPASYNRVLHALAATRRAGGSLLDALVDRAGSDPGKAKLASRFFVQLERKLAGQPGRVLQHLSPGARSRLEGYPGWGRIATLLA